MDARTIITLIGPPGAGKGTQTKKLVEAYSLTHIATGDLLREEVRLGTALGERARKYMGKGLLVPDEIVEELVRGRLNSGSREEFILDGFPRTVNQARFLEHVAPGITVHAINFRVNEEQILKRLSGRRNCPECGKIYNVYFSPPGREGICDVCGAELVQRADDGEAVVAERLRVYREQTQPVIRFYASRGNYSEVDADRDMAAVFQDLAAILESIRV